MKYGLVRLQNWQKLPVETHLLHTKYMLVRTCRMGNLPIRLHVRTDGWYTGLVGKGSVDAVYNIADAINKIGFGLVIYICCVNRKRTNKTIFICSLKPS
jgi:hypothetical protein